jgi:ribosomal protein S12 methylthiotransferase accessory factor
LACADSLDEAIERGICELIERDAMTIAWMKGVSPPRVDPVTVMEIAGEFAPPNDDVRVYDLTTDVGVPVMLAVCRGPSPFGQIIATGCTCRPDPRAALRHAMKEASQTRVYVRLLIEQDPHWQVEPDFSNVTDFSLHARMYTGRPKLVNRALAFLDHNDVSSRAFDDLSDDPIKREVTRSFDSMYVDLTQSWAESIGLYVVRVVANGLVPLHGDRRFVTVDHPRLANWVEVFPNGVRKHDHELWPYPHPFP